MAAAPPLFHVCPAPAQSFPDLKSDGRAIYHSIASPKQFCQLLFSNYFLHHSRSKMEGIAMEDPHTISDEETDDLYEKERKMAPEWAHSYNNRKGDSVKLAQSNEKGKYWVANRAFQEGDVVLVEDLLLVQPVDEYHPTLLADKNCQQLLGAFQNIRERHPNQSEEMYALLQAKLKNKLLAANSTAYILESPNLDEICKLEDSQWDAVIGDFVVIDGLTSKAGGKLNGSRGYVTRVDKKDSSRLGVNIDDNIISIKKCNLKTPAGIALTNYYYATEKDRTVHMGALTCRTAE